MLHCFQTLTSFRYANIRSFEPRQRLRDCLMDRHIIFRCPQTGLNVQHLLEAALEGEKDTYRSIHCPACTRLHFVNRQTGKLLGEK